MKFQNLIGLDINSVMEILKTYDKKIIVKDNNSNVTNFNKTSVVRIKEYKDFIEIITANFKILN